MADTRTDSVQEEPPILRCESPAWDGSPTPALGACPELSRCLSTASSVSHGSSTDAAARDSLGSLNSDYFSRQSSGSLPSRPSDPSSRQSTGSFESKSRRRGFVKPHGTDFAASARSRQSVMSLGSIAHIQHYFARTGLLDGKGAQLARKNKLAKPSTLDLSSLVSAHSGPKIVGSDVESSYASTGGSPELGPQQLSGEVIVESPITEENGSYFSDDYDDDGFDFLPPTVSTFQAKEEIVEKPPTIDELNADLTNALRAAEAALAAVRSGSDKDNAPKETQQDIQGWYELQGVHILDVMTLAIRAAKLYYTAHEQPDRLDAIKSEKELRADLLAVMDVLKRMASRNFAGGVADDELQAMDAWIAGVVDLLRREDEIVAAERVERAAWTWMRGGDSEWAGREVEREYLFLQTLVRCIHQQPQQPHQQQADAVAAVEAGAALPAWTPITDTTELPTPFLSAMQSGVLLVRLHNTAVRKSRRRFGAIGTFNTDTAKPYRAADNLRFWAKAAELRWEVMLKIDPLAIVYGSRREAWIEFDAAILKWCRKVREEITADYAVECVS